MSVLVVRGPTQLKVFFFAEQPYLFPPAGVPLATLRSRSLATIIVGRGEADMCERSLSLREPPKGNEHPNLLPMPLTPEQRARQKIDGQLTEAGWQVQDYKSIAIHSHLGVAVREYPLKWHEADTTKRGFADYLLYADGRALGVIEAKPAGHTLQGVSTQSAGTPKASTSGSLPGTALSRSPTNPRVR